MSLLVSSTEPKDFHDMGRTSTAPEKYGVDFLWVVKPTEGRSQRWGVQRKEINDLVASMADDRLVKEVAQSQALHQTILIVEGKVRFSPAGELITKSRYGRPWTQPGIWKLMASLQDAGWWVLHTQNKTETKAAILALEDWSRNDHTSLSKRGAMQSAWGKGTDREYAMWVLQSAPGIGSDTAKRIWDKLGPIVSLTATDEELLSVKGVGPKTVEGLRRAFSG